MAPLILNIPDCEACPLFAESCGQYDQNYCQHPIGPQDGSDDWVYIDNQVWAHKSYIRKIAKKGY